MSVPAELVTERWEQLSDPARAAVVELTCLLATGFTGTVEVHCNQGGTTRFEDTRSRNAKDLVASVLARSP